MNPDHSIDELTRHVTGLYLVVTKSGSRYQVEIDQAGRVRVRRTPAAFTINAMWGSSLFNDGDLFEVWIVQLRVGAPGVLVFFKEHRLQDDPEYLSTTRVTTTVESITKLSGGSDARSGGGK